MNPALGLIGFVVGFIVAYLLFRMAKRPKTYLHAELWVLLPDAKIPAQTDIMSRLLRNREFGPINPAVGLVMSDVRLDIGVVLREKNPTTFSILPNPLGTATSMVRIRFVSEQPVTKKDYLQFIALATEAYLTLGDGIGVYNPETEQSWTRPEFIQSLKADVDATRFDLWCQTRLAPKVESGEAETKGLRAIGVDDLRTPESPADHRMIVQSLLETLARHIWELGSVPPKFTTEAYGDRFDLHLVPRKGYVEVRMMRVQSS